MFGKAEWFRPSRGRMGVVPAGWQGWTYTGIWGGVVGLPAVALLANVGWVQSLIWLAASGGMWLWDVTQLRREMRPPEQKSAASAPPADDVLYIGDDEAGDRLATENFEMQLRK